jgi:hypothetical protein
VPVPEAAPQTRGRTSACTIPISGTCNSLEQRDVSTRVHHRCRCHGDRHLIIHRQAVAIARAGQGQRAPIRCCSSNGVSVYCAFSVLCIRREGAETATPRSARCHGHGTIQGHHRVVRRTRPDPHPHWRSGAGVKVIRRLGIAYCDAIAVPGACQGRVESVPAATSLGVGVYTGAKYVGARCKSSAYRLTTCHRWRWSRCRSTALRCCSRRSARSLPASTIGAPVKVIVI